MKYELAIPDSYGNALEAVQETPQKGEKFATILMIPGFGVDLHEYGYFDELSHELVKAGFQTFRFSFEGTGKSTGSFVDSSLDRQVTQLQDVFRYVKKDRFTDVEKIGVFAHSFGGIVTMSSLPLIGIHGLLLASVAADPLSSLQKYFREERGYRPDGISSRRRSDGKVTQVGPKWWKSIENKNFVDVSTLIKVPTLLLYGQKDHRFNADHGQLYYEAMQTKKRFLMIEKADHSFTGKFRPKALETIVAWFEELFLQDNL